MLHSIKFVSNIGTVIKEIGNSKKHLLKSKGEQRRSYCYVIDAVSGIFKVLFTGETGEAYNVANKNSIATIAEVAKATAAICGTDVRFELPDEIEKKGFSKPQNSVLYTEKLEKLGWKGKYTLEMGIMESICDIEKHVFV